MRTISIVALAACGLALGGCASGPQKSDLVLVRAETASMAVASVGRSNPKLRGAIAVQSVSGGKETNPIIGGPQVDDASFKAALETSLAANGYLATGAPKCALAADIQEIENPAIGIEFRVKSTITYRLSGCGPERTLPVTAEAAATFDDALIGATRLKLAKERSVQKNIRQFLEQIAN